MGFHGDFGFSEILTGKSLAGESNGNGVEGLVGSGGVVEFY